MSQQPGSDGPRWGVDRVVALAPDPASVSAGQKLAVPPVWAAIGWTGAPPVVPAPVVSAVVSARVGLWGLCRGSGKNSYRTAVDLTDDAAPAYQCSCPSRKFPCKHALALLLLW